ncbi:TonB-dependent receptor [Herbaspirillum sp. LeCh32-8]|uniref:TonB-dependent siderophore receptor n=1 Tax=Herbaspirillum sp. LeCh32-8 TaxID=2821356 RepID=UPI001AE44343|nr:TonB-dependent receptor [Herbaspirillum sp. LeCh32-8]MBP0597152.1 TonB-dependent receptor [Herbaspirillum sp. LeCh32-8]
MRHSTARTGHVPAARCLLRPIRAWSTTSHVLLAGSLALAAATMASHTHAAESAANPAAAAQVTSFSIPSGPLDQALNLYAARARVLLVVDPELTRGKQSAGLSGSYNHERALELLLSGSGLEAERRADGGVVIRQRSAADGAALPAVTVVAASEKDSGLKRAATSGALGARSVLNTPFSISVVEKDDIQDRQVTTIEQAFRFDPSVTSASGEYGRGSSVLVRGLGIDATNGFKMDGLAIPGWGNDLLPMEMFERVELLKGLSGFMYGFGSPGGIMNYVLKRPTEEKQFSVDVGYKSGSLFSEHIDVGGRAGDDQRLGYRVNLVHEQGGTYFTGGELKRDAASLALDLKLTNDLTWTFDTLYAKRKSIGNAFWGLSLGSGLSIPNTINPGTRQQPDGSYYNNENIMVSTGLQWRLNQDWKTRFDYRYAREDVDYVYSTINIVNAAGDTTASQSAGIYSFEFQQLQAMVEGKLQTGAIGHQLVFGASRQEYASLSDRGAITTAMGAGNIYRDTTLSTGGVNNSTHTQYRSSEIMQDALFASDTLSLGDKWSLIAGLRYTRFSQYGYNTSGATTSTYKRNPVTPTIALMYKPTEDSTVYGSYVEALERGGTAGFNSSGGRTANYQEVMGPIKSKQAEVGVKAERERWMTSAALFRIQRTAEYVNTSNYYVQDGETRYQGLDLAGRYDFTPALSLSGGLMWLDAKYKQTTAAMEGKSVTGAPHFQATAAVRYRVPQLTGLTLNAGGRYVGRSTLNTTTGLELPSYYVFDAGALYRTRLGGKDVTFNAQIQNLTDNRYWVYNGTNYIFAGAPRTLSLNARVEF